MPDPIEVRNDEDDTDEVISVDGLRSKFTETLLQTTSPISMVWMIIDIRNNTCRALLHAAFLATKQYILHNLYIHGFGSDLNASQPSPPTGQ